MAGTVQNPATPYVGPIQGGVFPGLHIHVTGVPEHHHNGFLISLQCGANIDPRCDCAFVFNPRFSDNQVVRNSLQHGSWGAEERHGGFPFHRGQRCEVTIAVTDHQFKVSVNGRHFCDYNHRMPKHRVTHISVEQGIKIQNIRFSGGVPQPCPYPASGAMPAYPGQPSQPVYNPPVPFVHHLGGLYPNKMIIISGIPNPNPSRFNVNFECNNGDNAFHFDARFNFGSDRHAIVRNTKQRGAWGGEERHLSYFPFQPNQFFDMIVLVEPYCFKVAVNNQHLLEFNHRIQQLNRIDTLRIDGDLRLTQVKFQ